MDIKKAACIYIKKDGKILAVSRRNNLNKFGLPGGKLDHGEYYKEAAVRELKEETGIEIDPVCLDTVHVGTCEGEYWCVTYIAEPINDQEIKFPQELKGDAGTVAWVDPEILYSGPFGEYNKQVSKAVESRQTCKLKQSDD
jgi:8-oxo-dGTP pyrophosphatase MutT (NUDIX family)